MAEHADLVAEIVTVEKMPTSERLKHAKKRRTIQLKKFQQYEKQLDKENHKRKKMQDSKNAPKKTRTSHVVFKSNISLLEAASRNDAEEVRLLMESGIAPDLTNEDGLTALHQCCVDDQESLVRLLLEHGANVNAQDHDLWTPLHAAATCGHDHLCKLLIKHGAELLAVNADGNMPYDICEDEVTLDFIENEMAKLGVTQELIDETRLSMETKMLEDMQTLAEEGGDLEFRGRSSDTPLHIAAANGYIQVAEFLLDHHVTVDAVDDDLWQPIHAAACWGQLAILELLVQSGADLEARTKSGETPLEICEDHEVCARIMEMRDELQAHRATKTRDLHRRRSQNSRSAPALYNSNTSLIDKSSASIRRTSTREKAPLALREAREEAQRLRNSNASSDEEDNREDVPPQTQQPEPPKVTPVMIPPQTPESQNVTPAMIPPQTQQPESPKVGAGDQAAGLDSIHVSVPQNGTGPAEHDSIAHEDHLRNINSHQVEPPKPSRTEHKPPQVTNGHRDSSTEVKGHRDPSTEVKGHRDHSTEVKGHRDHSTEVKGHRHHSTEVKGHRDSSTEVKGHRDSSTEVKGHRDSSTEVKGHRKPADVVSPPPPTSTQHTSLPHTQNSHRTPAIAIPATPAPALAPTRATPTPPPPQDTNGTSPAPTTLPSASDMLTPPSGTLADLKKIRAQKNHQLRGGDNQSISSQMDEHSNYHSDAENNILPSGGSTTQTRGSNGLHKPLVDPPKHKFRASNAEIIGGNETKTSCCTIL